MDGRGRWHNEHGPFEHPKIIAHFNAHIRRDAEGYYLSQELNGRLEKVYFPCEDTALFAVDLKSGPPEELLLNTGERQPLRPDRLAMRGDALYQLRGEERIKLTERCLLKLADRIEELNGHYHFHCADGLRPLAKLQDDDA
jgi:hypothetical protein